MFYKRQIAGAFILVCAAKYILGVQDDLSRNKPGTTAEKKIPAQELKKEERLYEKAAQLTNYPRLYKEKTDHETWSMFIDLMWYIDYVDQKSVIDSRSELTREEIVKEYQKIEKTKDDTKTKEQIGKFYKKWFIKEGKEEYLNPNTSNLKKEGSRKVSYAEMNARIEEMWSKFIRKPEESKNTKGLESKIHQKNIVVVPGGRFQEAYYWDFYWIAKGLHISNRHEEIKGMKKNFQNQIDAFGFIPNGTRWYYTNRSQPPYFIQILVDSMKSIQKIREEAQRLIAEQETQKERIKKEKEHIAPLQPLVEYHTSDRIEELELELTDKEIESAEKEFEFWDTMRTVTIEVSGKNGPEKHRLSRYSSEEEVPRPEMLLIDLASHENHRKFYETSENNTGYYRNIIAGTESGWDFSRRWREYNEESKMYGFLQTNKMVPVDLNSILVKNARILERIFANRRLKKKERKYREIAKERGRAIDAILWDEECSRWRDVIIDRKSTEEDVFYYRRKTDRAFYHSDLHPLYMDIADDPDNRILEAHESVMWIKSSKGDLLLPCTSSHANREADKETAEHSKEKQDKNTYGNPSKDKTLSDKELSKNDLLQKENSKIDQWDGHTIWPPLVQLTVEYLVRSKNIEKAQAVSESYLNKMYQYYEKHRSLPEKIEYRSKGTGEYSVQEGFGWSNGVAQWMLYVFERNKENSEPYSVK